MIQCYSSLKVTLIVSYISQGYTSLIGIILMPIYLYYMGIEAFGLIGFFLMLQNWLQLFDLGLSPTLSREISVYRASAISASIIRQRLRSVEWLLGLMALTATLLLILSRNWIATSWLVFHQLSSDEVSNCVAVIAVAAALRWLTGLYRAGLIGLERQIFLNIASMFFATLRFAGVIPLIAYLPTPLVFFTYQVFIALLEFSIFTLMVYQQLPTAATGFLPKWNALKAMLPMAGAMTFMTGIWIFTTQIDKLILSKLLSLEEYGYFTLAVMAANGILMLVPPLNQVLQPRMTILATQRQNQTLCELYQQATQVVTVLFFTVGGTLALLAQPVLFAWTGNIHIAQQAAPILFWYGLANIVIGLLVLPFLLQFAHGYLRLHVIGNALWALTLLPILVLVALQSGAVGAGIVIFVGNLFFLLFWVPIVHGRLMPQVVWQWPLRDILPIALAALLITWIVSLLLPTDTSRLLNTLFVLASALLSGFIAFIAGSKTRFFIKDTLFFGKSS